MDRIEPIQTSLVNGFLPRLEGLVDVLCFNPPYVVTTPEEVGSHGIEASWAGGIDGRQVIDEFLPFVPVSDSFFLVHYHSNPHPLTHSFYPKSDCYLLMAYSICYSLMRTDLIKWPRSCAENMECMPTSLWNEEREGNDNIS